MSFSLDPELDDEQPVVRKHVELQFTHADMLLMLVITFVSFWTRHFMICFPDEVTFDESHFGRFTNQYLSGNYFIDIHPPLAKLVLFGLAKVNQYKGGANFTMREPYANADYIGLRQIPALISSFCAPLVYVACKCFGLTTLTSLTAAVMIICDNSMIVEGKFILTDGIMHFFVCLAIATTAAVRTQVHGSVDWWITLVISGITVGFAVSSKLTALGLLPFVGFVHFAELFGHWRSAVEFVRELVIRGVVIAACIIVVYFAAFAIHFMVLPYEGKDSGMMSLDFRKSLLPGKQGRKGDLSRRTENQSVVMNTIHLNKIMHNNNMRISDYHPYGSRWYTWPFLTGKWVLFWCSGKKHIMCQGQVFNVYCGTLSVIVNFLYGINRLVLKRDLWSVATKKWLRAFAFAIGYCASLFPFMMIKRAAFFYHYAIPNIFGMLNYTCLMETILDGRKRARGAIMTLTQILTVAAFLFWAPWTYGIPIQDFDIRLWTRKWQ